MTDWMAIPNAIIRLDDELTKFGKKVQDALRGIYDREDETKERIAALEAKVQAQQEQIEALQQSPNFTVRERYHCTRCRTDFYGVNNVCPNCRPEQEQQEGWSILKNSLVDVIGYNDEEISDARIIYLLTIAGITPDTSDDDLAAMARLKEMRARGLSVMRLGKQPEQEQPRTWSPVSEYLWYVNGDDDVYGRLFDIGEACRLLNKSGTHPDDSDELLAARARLTEERLERGLELLEGEFFAANTHQALVCELLRELLGEGE